MKLARNILFKALGLKGYLRLVSRTYLLLVRNGFLKDKYPELFFLKQLIKEGDTCIDIGANLGYYSVFMSDFAGAKGKLFAVEPVPVFRSVWEKNIKLSGRNNYTMLPFALGSENKAVQMGMPVHNGVLHHGMTKVASDKKDDFLERFDTEMRIPDELFLNLERIDFIKCDVEGYEHFVFSNMQKTLEKFKPLIQSELGGDENRKSVIELLERIGYRTYLLSNNKLQLATANDKLTWSNDFYFKF